MKITIFRILSDRRRPWHWTIEQPGYVTVAGSSANFHAAVFAAQQEALIYDPSLVERGS